MRSTPATKRAKRPQKAKTRRRLRAVVRRPTRPQPDGDGMRARILDAAVGVFAEVGYAGATTREIATRAGIGKRMLFYYFPTKDAVYRAVLERVLGNMGAIHDRVSPEFGPVGLGQAAEAFVHFAAANLPVLKLLMREIMDGGPHFVELARERLRPLFARAGEEVGRNMADGVFRASDPMHVLMNVGGLTLFWFLNVPLLRLVWDRDPLDADTVAERARVVREVLLTALTSSDVAKGVRS